MTTNTHNHDNGLTRREFLKLLGLGAAALGSGHVAGRLANRFDFAAASGLSLQAFLPADPALAEKVLAAFWGQTGLPERLSVSAEQDWSTYLEATANGRAISGSQGQVRLTSLREPVSADLLLFDQRSGILDPSLHLSGEILSWRMALQGMAAGYLLTAVWLSEVPARRGPRTALVHNHKGLVDRLPLGKDHASIPVNGPYGNTQLRIENGQIWVKESSCRHALCQRSGAISRTGERLACAPNRLLVEIENG
jgi:hypothetical protein